MKKLFLTLIIIATCSISCNNERTSEKSDLKLNEDTFKSFANKLKFEDDFSVPLTNSYNQKISNEDISTIIINYLDEVEEKLNSSEDIGMIIFDVYNDGENLNFQNIKELSKEEIAKYGPTTAIGWFDNWNCPSGQTLNGTCYSQSCIQNILSGLATNMSSGETITIHHGGVGGVKICSNVTP